MEAWSSELYFRGGNDMNKNGLMNNLATVTKSIWKGAKKRSPEILTGVGIAGMVMSTVLAVRATPKALTLIAVKKEELQVEALDGKETVKAAGKCYIPAAAVAVVSIACLVGASSKNLRRNAALATAYSLSESTLKEYQEKVIETIGEEQEETIRKKVYEDRVDKGYLRDAVLIDAGGDDAFYDPKSGRLFKCKKSLIDAAVNEINRVLRDERYQLVNDFYEELGLEPTDLGAIAGWSLDYGYLEISYEPFMRDDGTVITTLEYDIIPIIGRSNYIYA
jgi:hypothetical protein